MNRSIRLERKAKWARRRVENVYMPREDKNRRYRKTHKGAPSLWFCMLDVRLLILRFIWRMDFWMAQYRWAESQHCCSCPLCTEHKRKWRGNAWGAKPIQERREILRANGF